MEGRITPLQTDVRFYTFGHSVNPGNPIGFGTLTRGCFTTVKCESTIPRREWLHSTDPSHFHHPLLYPISPDIPKYSPNFLAYLKLSANLNRKWIEIKCKIYVKLMQNLRKTLYFLRKIHRFLWVKLAFCSKILEFYIYFQLNMLKI